jgi:hypothetical protein
MKISLHLFVFKKPIETVSNLKINAHTNEIISYFSFKKLKTCNKIIHKVRKRQHQHLEFGHK